MDSFHLASTVRGVWAFDNRLELLLQRVVFRGTAVQVYRVGGLHLVVDNRASDAGSIRACISGPMYGRFLSQVSLPREATVLDLGANVGGFSLLLYLRGVRFRRLVCVEMNPNTYERLRFNLLSNEIGNVEVINAAVCGAARTLRVRLGRGSTGDSIYAGTDRLDGSREYEVRGRTLDEICETAVGGGIIDLCKMDIEGAEDEVLLGPASANASLSRMRYLLTELHHAEKIGEIVDMLRARGFEWIAGERGGPGCGVHLFRNGRVAEMTVRVSVPAAHTLSGEHVASVGN